MFNAPRVPASTPSLTALPKEEGFLVLLVLVRSSHWSRRLVVLVVLLSGIYLQCIVLSSLTVMEYTSNVLHSK